MKGISITILQIFFSTLTIAQHPYIPIPNDSAIWITLEANYKEGNYPNSPVYSYSAGIMQGSDTIINGKNYLSYCGEIPCYNLPLPVYRVPSYTCSWIRNDTNGRKVWYIRTKDVPYSEELLYDFSLKKGDTITDNNYYYLSPVLLSPYKAWVDDVDSINWSDGTWRYRYWIKTNWGNNIKPAVAIMIEGMGYVTGLVKFPLYEYGYLVSNVYSVLCFRHRAKWLYSIPNPWNADCDTMISRNIVPVGIENVFVNELSEPMLYPNPVRSDGIIFLNSYISQEHQPLLIEAFDILGRQRLHEYIMPGEKIFLNKYSLTMGIYAFTVYTQAGDRRYFQKIQVE